MAEQFLAIGGEMFNMRDVHRIKKDFVAQVNTIKVVFRHLQVMEIKFPDRVGRNAEFNIVQKELREKQPIVEIRGGTIEMENFHS